ncbi:MAG TPA: hypothetical protein VMV77_07250 [Bacteroidales bacterium]|nr:hypothetical protein [Bacteroidales bacterium]
MALIIFTLSGDTFTFSKGREYPVDDPAQVNVITGYSEARALYAYDKGIEEQFHNLVFDGLNVTDFNNVDDWIRNICVGPKNTFTYTDEDSATHTVRCLDTKNPLKEYAYQLYRGTIHLREEV